MSSSSPLATQWEMPEDAQSPEVLTAEMDPSVMGAGSEREASELPIDMAEWTQEEVVAYNALRSKRKKCCIGGCTHRSLPIARSYHQLPVRNKEIWAKWVEVIRWSRNEPEWTPNGDAAPLLCSRHFPDSDFISYEASSRVRLSHNAIPIYYIDPPEGTEMDARFSKPLPVPPIPAARQKESFKLKKIKLDDSEAMDNNDRIFSRDSGGAMKFDNYSEQSNSPPLSYADNLGYDIEEVDNYDDATEDMYANFHNYSPQFAIKREQLENNKQLTVRQIRQSAPPSLIHYQKNPKVGTLSSRPPALIRANFAAGQSSSVPKVLNLSANVKHFTKQDMLSTTKLSNPTTKHKINLAKCRLIVQTLENQLRIAKTRLADQLDVPYQVVNGVWNMRDSLKHKF